MGFDVKSRRFSGYNKQITDSFTQITDNGNFCFKPPNHGGVRDNHGWLANNLS